MSAWGQLLVGISSLIGAITGAGLGIYSVVRARREPRYAAENAAERLLHPDPDDEAALNAALEILLHHHPHEPDEGRHEQHHHGGGDTP